eukprot:TRINITY_DN110328_c0_g1_i1.p1 TRINITY_DN110328_c0_g1~~TRINITY_DN110328_c0_g1_i1.p1  ORF type:complete len:182 (-),score=40.61 TRINITY_DN110328_c0_g1_i1:46-591(-)
MPVAGVKLLYGARSEVLPGDVPGTALDLARLVASRLKLAVAGSEAGTPEVKSGLWLRLRGEYLPSKGSPTSMIIDSDNALRRYIDLAGRCRLYLEVRANVETLCFGAPKDTEALADHPLRVLLEGVVHGLRCDAPPEEVKSAAAGGQGMDLSMTSAPWKDADNPNSLAKSKPNPGYSPLKA